MYLFEHSLNGIQLVRTGPMKLAQARTDENKNAYASAEQSSTSPIDSAILLDAENLPAWCGVSVIVNAQLVEPAGNIKRILAFGNWENYQNIRRGSWLDIIRRYKIQAVQVDRCPGKKNAADIALAVNATLLYQTGGISRFYIMSNDGDYLYLVKFLRERGCSVYGYGTVANQQFQESFTRFFTIAQ